MSNSRKHITAITAAAILAAAATVAHADVMYTTAMIMGGANGGSQQSNGQPMPGVQTTTYDKGTSERKEMSMQMGPMQMKTITIENCGENETIKLDPADKLYAVDPLGGFSVGAPSPPPMNMYRPQAAPPQQSNQTGTSDVTFTAQDLGTEKIGVLATHHSMFTVHTVTTGCAGNNDSTMKMEIWTAPIPTYDCPIRFQATPRAENSAGSGTGGCKVTYQMHGDFLAMRSAMSGMVVQMKLYNGDKVSVTQKLVTYSSAPLDPSLFQVPDDYRKVSDQELAQAQQRSMLAGMGMPNAGQPPADNNQNGNPQDNFQDNTGNQNNGDQNNGDQNNGDNQPPPKKKNPFGGIHLPF